MCLSLHLNLLSGPTTHSPSIITLASSSFNNLSYFFNIYFSLSFYDYLHLYFVDNKITKIKF